MDGINKEQTGKDMMAVRKKIGKTIYEVSLHFSKTSTESAHDKLKRIIINDCTNPCTKTCNNLCHLCARIDCSKIGCCRISVENYFGIKSCYKKPSKTAKTDTQKASFNTCPFGMGRLWLIKYRKIHTHMIKCHQAKGLLAYMYMIS